MPKNMLAKVFQVVGGYLYIHFVEDTGYWQNIQHIKFDYEK
jgi:hypothetical protein